MSRAHGSVGMSDSSLSTAAPSLEEGHVLGFLLPISKAEAVVAKLAKVAAKSWELTSSAPQQNGFEHATTPQQDQIPIPRGESARPL